MAIHFALISILQPGFYRAQKLKNETIELWVPWVILDANKSLETAQGVLIELYKGMKYAKVFDYELQLASAYGVLGQDKKWTGMVGSLLKNETDVGGPYFVEENRGKVIRFVSPLDFSQLVLVTGLIPENTDPFMIFRVFSITVWLTLLSFVFIVAGTACLVYSVWPSSERKRKVAAYFRYLWMFQTSLLGKEFGSNSRWFPPHPLHPQLPLHPERVADDMPGVPEHVPG
ncbi:lig_chan-Glu_bd domain-containing protein [Caerostris extrusa]|uniref:Lig_chan-Glu_bd domain-containing protein n=1 Tax=Caerostris extrusa TaxID=172846 RepID=A0AAV4QEH3_CAEEX|nr:lig_chan-Glu_bd domain-containing protein [Caerostris extrusa]